MNPSELRMMWMSQYNPERITLEDAATFFGHPSVGLSVMDDLAGQQQQLDLNPMMGLVGGDFSGQAAAAAASLAASSAAAAAALGVQPATLFSNTHDIYGIAQMGSLQQQLLQQSAAAVFQNYTDMMNEDDDGSGNMTVAAAAAAAAANGLTMGLGTNMASVSTSLSGMPLNSMGDDNSIMDDNQQLHHHHQTVYDQMDDGYDELTPKQEIINIDDFVMMNDSNSYDDNDFINTENHHHHHNNDMSQNIMTDMNSGQNLDDTELLINMPSTSHNHHNSNSLQNNLLNNNHTKLQYKNINNNNNSNSVSPTSTPSPIHYSSSGNNTGNGSVSRSQRKTRKIEPVNRPGLVLKTPIAYKGNIDPSVIPIQKDGMAVCERCGAIGVKHTFYTKSRRFCSMACARGELYSLVLNNKITSNVQQQQQQQNQTNKLTKSENMEITTGTTTKTKTPITTNCSAAITAPDTDEHLIHKNSSNNDNAIAISQQKQQQSDIELALCVAHIKNSNYRFHLVEQQEQQQQQQQQHHNITKDQQQYGNNNNNNISENKSDNTIIDLDEIKEEMPENIEMNDITTRTSANHINALTTTDASNNSNNINNNNNNSISVGDDEVKEVQDEDAARLMPPPPAPLKPVRMYRDVLPQEELPQIPKYDMLPATCPQLEKMISVRRRAYDPSHSYDWTARLTQINFYAAPVTCFKHAPGYDVWDNLDIDMKVEVENTDCDYDEIILPGQNVRSFWVASILKICGYKALVRYEGFDTSSRDFWVNLCNAEVHAVGWCATRGKPLIPPLSIAHKYRDWKDFLVARLSGARTLPTNFYNKINDSMQSRFRIGINLECVDKDHISQVRLATVTKIIGKRLFLRYFDSEDGFLCHEDSPIIHPVGWATTVGHNLAAPQDYLQRMLAGRDAMIEVHEDDATIELFKMNFTFEEYYMDGKTNGFMDGMKLEAVDPLNLSSICAATIMAVLKFGYIMIRIDSYQPDATNSDWFCYHEKSPSIFPVGFCQSNNIALTPPNGFENKNFVWDVYLRETVSVAAPQNLFHRIVPDHHFEVGMSLECADLMDPRLVCVASVVRVVGRLLRIHFDGWTDEYDQWLDCESPDIYPVGWCVLVNHKLEGPPTTIAPINTVIKTTVTKTKATAQRGKRGKKKTTLVANQNNSNNNSTPIIQTVTSAIDNLHSTTDQIVQSNLGKITNKSQIKQQQQQQQQFKKNNDANAVKPRTIPLRTNPDQPKLSIKLELKPEHYHAAYYDNNPAEDDDDDSEEEETVQSITAPTTIKPTNKTTSPTSNNINNTKKPEKSVLPTINQIKQQTSKMDNLHKQQQQQNQRLKTVRFQMPTPPPAAVRRANSYIGNSAVSSSKYIPRLSDCATTVQQGYNHPDATITTTSSSSSSQATTTTNDLIGDLMPETWNIYDVSQFLRVNDCTVHCDTFSRNKIDGKRLMLLSKDEIITLLGMKVGPALKIYDLIQQLKCKVNPNKQRQQLHKPNKSFF